MDTSAEIKRRIFITYRSLFSSVAAQLQAKKKKKKKIEKIILNNGIHSQDLVKELGLEKVVRILMHFLEKGLFESELNAKVEFPDLFESRSCTSIQRTSSEYETARCESEILDAMDADTAQETSAVLPTPDRQIEVLPKFPQENNSEGPEISLHPSYIPYKAQHLLLTTVQHILEECCFDFAKTWLPEVLQSRKWECAEAVELTKWLSVLNKRCDKIPPHASTVHISSLQGIMSSVRRLRHTAVHRLPITARGTCELIQSAAKLSENLKDPLRTAQLEAIAQTLGSLTQDMELHKKFLENTLDANLQSIRRQRAELDQREAALIASTEKEDANRKALVGSLVEEFIQKIIHDPLSR